MNNSSERELIGYCRACPGSFLEPSKLTDFGISLQAICRALCVFIKVACICQVSYVLKCTYTSKLLDGGFSACNTPYNNAKQLKVHVCHSVAGQPEAVRAWFAQFREKR